MSDFERVYQTDPPRESDFAIESTSIELSDKELLLSRDMEGASFVYKQPPKFDENMPESLKKKFELAKKIYGKTQVTDLRKTDAKSESKSPKSKPKKDNTKSNKSAVARVQKEL